MSVLAVARRIGILASALALGVAAWAAMASTAPPAAPDSIVAIAKRPPRVAAIGTYAVGRTEQTFVDNRRPTKANGAFPGAPSRALHTTIYYPARNKPGATASVTPDAPRDRKHGPYPLILFSHGNNSFGQEYEPLLAQWASAGYAIAAPDYPLSNKNAPGGATVGDLDQQPKDAGFVIDQLVALSAKRSGTLSHLFDAKRIGTSGHSLGALTTYRLVYQTCCADKRVKAAAPMAGVAGDPPDFFTNIATPLLALHGDSDGTVPYQSSVNAFGRASPPKFLLTVVGGQHTPPFRGAAGPGPNAVTHVTLAFFDRYLKDDINGLKRLHHDADVPGVVTLQEQATP